MSRRRKPHSLALLIDQTLQEKLVVVREGRKQRITKLEAIYLKLLTLEVKGNARAASVRLEFERFAAQRGKRSSRLIYADASRAIALHKTKEPPDE